ncbi:MAG: triose-phosphate isomerase [Candidatus Portnoybacteria bacterium CG10_big_fil_rev_8_21_14_0_10_36_7]|uniref:Triosephosphate isomerase n=1 Tax=Candidatus Portnoybacteria bacterium CG10_big_fil_rev_8_21_14_0_10_36_7 TaxID=1974812 RepID=A0A2M8KDA9_9BACT|nr:MAG: triose-phosphate isomerase [Candidatus Portnoybacteria bacterium CG10_big_fil_rev_8_21_14_0_10_36_7]
MKPLVIANWKMNPLSSSEADNLFSTVKKEAKKLFADVVICPPYIYLQGFQYPTEGISLGAQNMFYEERGAYTGEVSAIMLKSLGVSYVILGHSERRSYFGESDQLINKKLKEALRCRIRPILCVGEKNRDERDIYEQEIEQQIVVALEGVSSTRVADVIIVYEPTWTISTSSEGHAATPEDILKMSVLLRKILTKLYGRPIAHRVKLLYGGSVTSHNVHEFVVESKMDGVLVGAASLNVGEFVNLIKSIS